MTNGQTTTPVILDPEADDAWRGVAAEDTDDISQTVGIKLQARSRRLLGSLIRPRRWWALLAATIVLISELAYLVGPLAVAYGIDTAVPELAAGNPGPLVYATLVYLGQEWQMPRARRYSCGSRRRLLRPCCWTCAAGFSATPRR